MKRISTRLLSILLTAMMVLTIVPMTVLAEEEHSFTDTADHWAENAIDRWSGYEVVNGNGDGTFAPDANLTRAEMAQIYVNLLHLTEKADISKFTDIPQDAWYADAVARCVAAGILNGTGENTISPLDAVTREQMFVTFGRAVGMSPADTTDSGLNDLDEMSDWSEGMINALLNAGYISGMGDNTLQPLSDINRASVVSLLDKTIGGYGNKSGVTLDMTGEDKLVLIVSGDVTVTGQTGDIIILQGAAEGTVKLEDADISGKVTLSAPGAKLEITGNTSASDIVVGTEAKGAEVTVAKDAVVDNLTTSADNTAVSVSGKIENVNVESGASDITVNAEKGATVGKVTTSGKNTAVSGNGTVTDVEASEGSSGTKVETEGTKVENNGDGNVTTGTGSVVKPGETGTTSGNSGSGGSTGGSGGSSHSHRYTDGVCSCGAYDPSWAQVNSAETWNQAVSEGKNIVVTADFTADSQLQISNPVTVNGIGKTITAGSWDDANTSSKGDASLVLINHVSGSIVLENITLTGAKTIDSTASGGQKDYGHGLNIYESGDVTLKNVTLRDNAGAGMVVNSSGVNAEGLHTSGNAWGGVNIDKNSGESAPDASLTFDASSVFEEAAAIYSDNGGVTVTYPDREGWAHLTDIYDKKDIWTAAFAGGLGTQENPYEIASVNQFNNIEGLSAEMKNGTAYHFLQTADIVLTKSGKYLCGTYDGGNHAVTSVDKNQNVTYLFEETWGTDVVIEKLNLISRPSNPMIGVLTNCAENLTFRNITIDSVNNANVVTNSNNMGFLLINAMYEGWGGCEKQQYLFENITNNVNITNAGTCTSPFVGSGPCLNNEKSSITYRNCVNNGDITGTSFVGFYYGNKAYIDSVRVEGMFHAEGCINNGILMAASDNGQAEISLGKNDFVDRYESIEGEGSTVSGNQIKDAEFSLAVDESEQKLVLGTEDQSSYTYRLVANIGTIYWNDGYVSNGIKVVIPADSDGTLSEDRIGADDFEVYDKQTAVAKGIISADENFTEQQPAGGYRYIVKIQNDKVYLILDVGEKGSINSDAEHPSDVSLYVYAYEGDKLVGTQKIS